MLFGGISRQWDISNASYTSKSFDVGSEDTNPQDLFIGDDGSKMYMAGSTNTTVYQYTLSTNTDISTASYASKSLDVSTQISLLVSLFFRDSGSTMYALDNSVSKDIYQYSLSTDWDVSTGSYASKSLDLSTTPTNPISFFINNDGTKLYVLGADDVIYQWTMSTPWDISTGSYDSLSFDAASESTTMVGMSLSADLTKLFLFRQVLPRMFQYTLSTAGNISTASYDSVSFDMSSQLSVPKGMFFDRGGAKFYIQNDFADENIYQYST